MSRMTITEALAELKTLEKRIGDKRDFVKKYLARQEMVRDPLEKDGGSARAIKAELQAIGDLMERRVAIRRAIALANQQTLVQVNGEERSIADWITWKRENLPTLKMLYQELSNNIAAIRQSAQSQGKRTVEPQTQGADPKDIVVHIDEKWLKEAIENLTEVEGTLDGQLSLRNATVFVEF